MNEIERRLTNLSGQLLPTGRAFRMFNGSNMQRLFSTLARTEREAYDSATSIFNCLIPDNSKFTTDDATDWERRLGMVSNQAVSFADREAAILRKMAAPGKNPSKSHYLWMEHQLQLAGFAVNVYENIPETNPATINPAIISQSQHGDFQHGQQSAYINHIVVKSLNNAEDILFDIGHSLRATYFIGGNPLGTYANIPAAREKEFRQLILMLKQTQNAAILFINYI